jgi:hypothetical protein
VKCVICGKESCREFCEWHEAANKNLSEKFKDWQNAMEITWEKFLEEVKENPNSGIWAKEVATYILEKGKK